MFQLFQFLYMTVFLISARLKFNYQFINASYLIFVTFMAVWNGGSYYIQIFSQRYNNKFITKKAEDNATEETLDNSTDKSE